MSFLFQHKKRPFREQTGNDEQVEERGYSSSGRQSQSIVSSEDEEIIDEFSQTKSSSQPKKRGRKAAFHDSKSSSNKIHKESNSHQLEGGKWQATVNLIDEEAKNGGKEQHRNDDEDPDAFPLFKKKSSYPLPSIAEDVIEILDSPAAPASSSGAIGQVGEEDEITQSIKALKSKLLSTKRSLVDVDSIDLIQAKSSINSSSNAVSRSETTESEPFSSFPSQRTYSIPKVISAAERTELLKKTSFTTTLRLDREEVVEGEEDRDNSSSKGTVLSVKTRLKGKGEKTWSIGANDPFIKLQERIIEAYSLEEQPFSLIFDGEAIDLEESTPGELGLEDGDLLEIKLHDQQIQAKKKR